MMKRMKEVNVANTRTAEAMILAEIYDAATARAQLQAQQLRKVAREILYSAGRDMPPGAIQRPVMVQTARPSAQRKRLRFSVPKDAYDVATSRIRASGMTITRALEEGLERYAKTGDFR